MIIQCQNCHKPLQIDEAKLPMKEVAFPCPNCKARIVVDRRNAPAAEAAAPSQPASAFEAEIRRTETDDEEEGEEYSNKALIVGADNPLLRQAAKSLDLGVVYVQDPVRARDYYVHEYPPVVFLNPPQITPPPLADYGVLTNLAPVDRRRGFFILIAENLRTMDGNAAFLYGVNLVIATKDLASFKRVYREAETAHKRLYQAYMAVAHD